MRTLWQTIRAILPPLILAALLIFLLREPVTWWLYGEEIYDQEAIKEWIREARNVKTLPELVTEYLDVHAHERRLARQMASTDEDQRRRHAALEKVAFKREEIEEFL